MAGELASVLLGTSGLAVAAAVALWLTLARPTLVADRTRVRAVARLVAVAVLAQAAHFAEELATGFHRSFPALLGLAPWPATFFVSFNVLWLVAWTLAIPGFRAGMGPARFALWFLAVAGVANGLGHPAMAAVAGGYFPGLATSPLLGVLGLALLRRLAAVTGPAGAASAGRHRA